MDASPELSPEVPPLATPKAKRVMSPQEWEKRYGKSIPNPKKQVRDIMRQRQPKAKKKRHPKAGPKALPARKAKRAKPKTIKRKPGNNKPLIRSERLDMKISKKEKALLRAEAKRRDLSVTQVVVHAITKFCKPK
jgi:hypothetical protein